MYAYQKVRLVINEGGPHMIEIPPMNNFKMVLTGNSPNHSNIEIYFEVEGATTDEAQNNLLQEVKNLKLYINLYSDNNVDVIPESGYSAGPDKWKPITALESLTNDKLSAYLSKRTTQQHLLLQTALDELKNNDMFNAFPKLINWLDENDHKGASRFCSIRDSCDHGTLEKYRAIKKVNDTFPDEFEFEDDILKRDSEKNKESMKKHLPEVMNHIKHVFKTKYVT